MFGQNVGFNFSEKSSNYRSWVGSLATIIILVLTLTAIVQNAIILYNRDGTLITQALHVNQNDDKKNFTQDDGFQMAIAIYDFV